MNIIIRLLKFSFILMLFSLFLQGEENLLLKKVELQEKMAEIRKDIAEEKKYFAKFINEKKDLIKQKSIELTSVKKEILDKKREVSLYNRRQIRIGQNISNIRLLNNQINRIVYKETEKFKENIENGIPFDREKRLATISALNLDIKANKINPLEVITRLFSFLNNEEKMSYDSQVVRSIEVIDGKNESVDLLRIGRVFFAVSFNKGFYIFKQNEKKEWSKELEKVSIFDENNIKKAFEVVQSKRPPQLVLLPFKGYIIEGN